MGAVAINPSRNTIVNAALFLVLGCSEGHALFLGVTILVREQYHEVLAREMLLSLNRQSLKGALVRNSTLTGCYDDKHVVVADFCCQLG